MDHWWAFLKDAGVQTSVAKTYAAIFVKNNIAGDTLEDLDRDDLVFMGISALGDIKRILKHAKGVDKNEIFLRGTTTLEL